MKVKMTALAVVSMFSLVGCLDLGIDNKPTNIVTAMSLDVSSLASTSDSVVVKSDVIDFGKISANSKEWNRVAVELRNDSNATVTVGKPLALTNGFSLGANKCETTIAPGATCKVYVWFSTSKIYNGEKQSSFVIKNGANSISINLHAEVVDKPLPALTGTADVQVTMANPFNNVGLVYREMKLENVGTGTAIINWIDMPSDYAIRHNGCPSLLEAGAECVVEVLYKDYENTSPSDQSVVFDMSSPDNAVVGKEIKLLDGTEI